jgi:hypothetical protein
MHFPHVRIDTGPLHGNHQRILGGRERVANMSSSQRYFKSECVRVTHVGRQGSSLL